MLTATVMAVGAFVVAPVLVSDCPASSMTVQALCASALTVEGHAGI